MRPYITAACLILAGLVSWPAAAGETKLPWEEYDKLIKARTTIAPMGPDLFGDEVNLYNSTVSFSQTDISLPGNNALPVALTRTFAVNSKSSNHQNDMPMADWDLSLPRLSGVFGSTWHAQRCSGGAMPPSVTVTGGVTYPASQYWHGNEAHMPGGGEMLLADQGAQQPSTGGPYRWMTPGFTYFSCLPSIGNGTGEGFLAITLDGTRYWFNWMAQYYEPPLQSAVSGPPWTAAPLTRKRNVLYATRVEDRFGNWVTYSFSNSANAPARLTAIQSSDQRQITLTYNVQGQVATANDGTHTWTYQYAYPRAGKGTLTGVVQPDGRAWAIDFEPLSSAEFEYDGDFPRTCDMAARVMGIVGSDGIGRITHPSGAVGEFEVGHVAHGRSNVPKACINWETPSNNPRNDVAVWPRNIDVLGLKRKQVTGPGLAAMEWTYASSAARSWAEGTGPVCNTDDCDQPRCLSDDCAGTARTTITASNGEWTRYIFGNSYRYNEGKLLTVERGSGATTLRTETTAYQLAQSGQPFPTPIGTSPQSRGDGFTAEYLRPQRSHTILQDGVAFSSTVNTFDEYARATSVTKSSTLGGSPSKTEVTAYHDNLSRWVLGQPAKLTVNGVVASETSYHATHALPTVFKQFGKTVQTLSYKTDGTVATVKDGNNNVTTLGSWYRGIPRSITYPDSTTQAAVVNAVGWITRITDENGFATNYAYDVMGRLSQITWPASDSVAWNATTFTFAKASSSAYGIPAGHWQHTVATGNGRKTTYLDALWRPILVREYDTGVSGTQRFTRQTFDHEGRVTFASYPSTSGTPTTGTWTEYDALGRMTSVTQDSELSPLTTLTAYLSGFRTRVTSPKGQQTLTSYLAWDRPTIDYPVAITHPQGAYTDIARDVFGKPAALTRRNDTGSTSLTRRYVYDANQQLCKTIEPETGATVMAYDGAGNLTWSASGQSYPSTTACNTANVAANQKAARTYDARNRIKTLTFPDGRGNTSYSYTPDGLLSQLTVDNGGTGGLVTTAYTYNKRRLPVGEALGVGSHQWGIGTGYNANGHPNVHTLPGGLTVDYAPNALGQPTKAGAYATNVGYFPNGAIKQFTYGNGITHTLAQNARGLPDRSRDAYGSTAFHDDNLDYDAHGNVAAISDGLPGNRGNRTMTYDALDRLTKTVSPMFGTANYTYDVLDNLRAVQLTAGPKSRNHTYSYDANHRLTSIIQASGGAAVASLDYDAQGNLANKNGLIHTFDFGNRLRQITGVEQYRYDGHGRRVQAIRNGASIYSIYGQDGVLRFQRDERTGQTIEYVYLGGSLVARLRDPIPLATPTLTVPGYSATGSYTITWSPSALATRYQLQEQVNGGGWTTIHDAAGTSKAISGKPAGIYGYHIRACSPSTCGSWSDTVPVTVQLPPDAAPALQVPGTGLNGSYTVSWDSVPAADTYQLQERQGTGSWSTIHNAAGISKAISGKAAGNWSYQVRGCNAAGCGPWSATATVNVILKPTGAPTLTVPPGDNYTGSYSITWNSVGTATRYELEERLGTGAWSQIHNASTRSKAVTGRTAGTWGYRARACNAAGCGPYSAIATVQVILPPTGVPTLSMSVTSSNTGSYTATWNTVGVATKYHLQERLNSGSWSTIHDAAGTSKAISGKATGTWTYQIRACNAAGCAAWSGIKTVQVTRPPANAPTGLAAPASSSTGNYSVTWNPVSAATSYQLQQRKNGGSWSTVHNAAATSRSFSAQAAGTYDYQVRACNGGGCSGWSGIKTTQVTLPLSAPTLNAPSSVSTNDVYTVSWNGVGGATSYELQQNRNGGAWSTIQNSAATSMVLQRGPATYQYQVRACSASSCSPYSAPRTVQVLPSTDALPDPEEDA